MSNHGVPNWADEEEDEGGLIPTAPENLKNYKDTTFNVLMKGRNDELKNTRPKTIYNILHKTKPINKINSCKKLRSGDFLMNIDIQEKGKVLQLNKIGDIPVLFKEAWDMNNTKVTIFCKDLVNFPMNNDTNTNEELLNDLQTQNTNPKIINAEILTTFDRVKKKRINNTLAIVTLEGRIPETELLRTRLMLNFESLPVKLYIPDPKICKNCWSYDHISTKRFPCPNQKVCGNCAENFHLQTENNKVIGTCVKQAICVNCNRYHPAWSKQCHYYKREKNYWEIATKQRIPYNQAKQIKENQSKTYASTAASAPIVLTAQPTDNYRQQTVNNQQQIDRQDYDREQISNIITQLKFLTDVVSKLCKINKITIEDSEVSENDESMNTNSEDETIPATQYAPGRVPGLNQDELTKFKMYKGNNNRRATFKRAEQRREKKMDQKTDNSHHPSKIPKRS